MKTIRAIAMFSVIAAAGCASNAGDQAQMERSSVAGRAAHDYIAALHATIPASESSGNVFEYSSPVNVPAPKTVSFAGDQNGNVFEYN